MIFLTLLGAYFLWEAFRRKEVRAGFVYAAAGVVVLAYFTWQGSLLLLPALLIAVLALTWGRVNIWRSPAVWTTLAATGAIIALHLWRRSLMTAPQLVLGTGLNTEIGPVFLKTVFDPWVYVYKFLAAEAHICLLAAGLLGLLFCWRDRTFRFLVVLLLAHTVMSTAFLYPNLARYLTGETALYVLIGSAGLVGTIRAGLRVCERAAWTPRLHWLATGIAAIVVFILGAWTQVTPLYRFTNVTANFPRMTARERLPRGPDVRRLAEYARPRMRPGDAVIAVSPVPVVYYFGRCDYFIQSTQQTQVHLTAYGDDLVYIHKVTGSDLIRSIPELQDVMRRRGRVWLVAASEGRFRALCDQELVQFVLRNFRDVQHSVRSRLWYWEGFEPPAADEGGAEARISSRRAQPTAESAGPTLGKALGAARRPS